MIIERRSPHAELKRYIVAVVILWFNLMFQTFYVLPYNIYVHCQFCLTSHFVSKHFLKSHFFSLITKPPQRRNEWCCLVSQLQTSMRKNNHKWIVQVLFVFSNTNTAQTYLFLLMDGRGLELNCLSKWFELLPWSVKISPSSWKIEWKFVSGSLLAKPSPLLLLCAADYETAWH